MLPRLQRIIAVLAGALVLRVTASIVANYPGYLPPDFSSNFLRGREDHFLGLYQWAFYTHILSGPVALVVGLVLVSPPLRRGFPTAHRVLGWVQVGCVVGLVTPSGLVMARHAAAGPVAGAALALLALTTALCTVLGARAAATRHLEAHRRWMGRSYALLCSAVVLRLMGGLAVVTGLTAPWVDPAASWACWLLPLGALELYEQVRPAVATTGSPPGRRGRRS
jgi:hypothetical protein